MSETKQMPISEAIRLAIGAASMAWSEQPKGAFDEAEAAKIAEGLAIRIELEVEDRAINIIDELRFQHPDQLMNAVTDENTDWTAKQLYKLATGKTNVQTGASPASFGGYK